MAPPVDNKATTRRACSACKRWVFAITNLITGIITCVFISYAYKHYQVISSNPTLLKTPYGNFDLANEKMSYAFAIGRVVFVFTSMLFSLSMPEWMVFTCAALNLVFEVPMAAIAQSNFGYLITFATLDLSPPGVYCASTAFSEQQWAFYSTFGRLVDKRPVVICEEFAKEGELLRASLLFAWFTMWISFFVFAFCFATMREQRKWSDILVHLTGYDLDVSWADVKRSFSFKIARPSMPRLRRRPSRSDSSTLADETVEVKVEEKV